MGTLALLKNEFHCPILKVSFKKTFDNLARVTCLATMKHAYSIVTIANHAYQILVCLSSFSNIRKKNGILMVGTYKTACVAGQESSIFIFYCIIVEHLYHLIKGSIVPSVRDTKDALAH